jgi:hypothetical protein
MHQLLSTSPNIAALTPPDNIQKRTSPEFVEGNGCAKGGYKRLFGPHSIETNMEHVYSNPNNYNWLFIKESWDKNWEIANPVATIRMQKTPADVIRLKMMLPYFPNLKWLISVRNPYMYAMSIMDKSTFMMDPIKQLDQVCHHVTRIMELQKENKELLGKNAYVYTYEDFVRRPKYHVKKMIKWLPEIKSIDLSQEIIVKGEKVEKIYDSGPDKFKILCENVPDVINMMNEHFYKKREIIEYWGYTLMINKG